MSSVPPPPTGPKSALRVRKPPPRWECVPCDRSMAARDMERHVVGKEHMKRQAAWDAQRMKKKQEEEEEQEQKEKEKERVRLAEVQRVENEKVKLPVPGAKSALSKDLDQVVVVGRAGSGAVEGRPGMWECEVCERGMLRMSKKSHLRGKRHLAQQLKLDGLKQKKQEEGGEEAKTVRIQEEARKKKQEEEETEARRIEKVRVGNENEKRRAVEEEARRMEQGRIEDERRRNEELEQAQKTEQIRIALEAKEANRRTEELSVIEKIRQTEQLRDEASRNNVQDQILERKRLAKEQEQNHIQAEAQRIAENNLRLNRQRVAKEAMEQEQIRAEADRIAENSLRLNRQRIAKEHQEQEQVRTEEQRIRERYQRLEMKRLAKEQAEQSKAAEERRKMELFWRQHEERERERIRMEEEEEAEVERKRMQEVWVLEEQERKRIEQLQVREEEERRVKELERLEELKRVEELRIRQEAEECKRIEETRIQQEEELRLRALRIKEEEEEKQRVEMLQIEEERKKAETLRIQQEEEEQRKLEELRIQAEAEEDERKQQLQQQQAQAQAEHIAEQERIHEKTRKREQDRQQRLIHKQQKREEKQRRREEYQHQRQIDEILAREQQALVRQAEFPTFTTPSFVGWTPSPGSSMGPGASVHEGDGGAGEDSGYRAKMFQYLESQGIMHEGEGYGEPAEAIYNQQSPQPQVLTEYDRTGTFPLPVQSVTDLPPILYRVYDDTSVSKYYWQGFQAGAMFMPLEPLNFKHMVQRHGNWSSREGTPFVSVTSSPDAAGWHVAKKQASGGQTNIMVALIDTAALLGPCGTTIWKMHDAMDHFGLQPWKCERRAYDNEYLCGLRIPPQAIFACCQPDYFMDTALMFLKNLEWKEGGKTAARGKTILTIRPPDIVVPDQAVVSDVVSVPDEELVLQDTEADELVDSKEVLVPETDEALGSDAVVASEET